MISYQGEQIVFNGWIYVGAYLRGLAKMRVELREHIYDMKQQKYENKVNFINYTWTIIVLLG